MILLACLLGATTAAWLFEIIAIVILKHEQTDTEFELFSLTSMNLLATTLWKGEPCYEIQQ